ncbi:hypothetical protein Pfo_019458 [Paulownia fortunei]|nr:hypothetical protein Pfo_019458 [Paulownia fortunei]
MGTLMIRKKPSPEWLVPWLQTPFYGEKCRKHVKQHRTVYCGVCMGEPVCETCWKDRSKEHQDHHPVLHVRIASERAAIETEDIRKFWDVSYIQQYIINHKNILHLNPKLNGAREAKHNPKCETCKRKLKDSNCSFCSITCKFMSKEWDMQIEETQESPDSNSKQPTPKRKSTECYWFSIRKKSRKGISRRAPLK